MATSRPTTEAHALAQRLIRISEMAKASFAAAVAEHGLTAPQARALFFLEEPSPMRALSDHLSCDASNLTGIADRLETRGLVERVQGEDRRVRLLRLTEKGERVRRELGEHVKRSPMPSDRLTATERRQLMALLDKMLDD